jgi:hypothetical protein
VKPLLKILSDIDKMNTQSINSKGRSKGNGPSPLRQAAARLAEAAAQLSAAAQAMSVAANQLSAANSASRTGFTGPPEPVDGKQVPGSPIPDEKNEQSIEGGVSDEEYTNPEDSDYYISGENCFVMQLELNSWPGSGGYLDEEDTRTQLKQAGKGQARENVPNHSKSIGPMKVEKTGSNLNGQPPHVFSGSEKESFRYAKTTPKFRSLCLISKCLYSVLVDTEGDVLPVVCSIIKKYNRVVCYMGCGLPAVSMYKDLVSPPPNKATLNMYLTVSLLSQIQSLTATTVHTITKSTPAELIRVGAELLKNESSILLLPETVFPDIKFDASSSSCVIHMDWPSDAAQCTY